MTEKQPELRPHKIESSGEVVHIKRSLSYAMLLMDLQRENPKPQAPMQEVIINGESYPERNYADPDYIALVSAWDDEIKMKASLQIIESSVHVHMTDERKEAVRKFRKEKQGQLPLSQPDSMVFLKYIAITSDDDFQSLLLAIRNQTQPSEEGIETAVNGF